MGVEIERKFLVDKKKWDAVKVKNGVEIIQGYLHKEPKLTVRIRIKGEDGFITLKGKTVGISRSEFEYRIPKAEAHEMIKTFCDKFIHKTRFTLTLGNKVWEIDEFISPNKGLVLAEVELTNEQEEIDLPNWVTKEVSDNPNYFNANML